MNDDFLKPVHLTNELVLLKPLTLQDFDQLFLIASDPLIWEQHPTKDRYKKEVFQLFFDGAIKSNSAFSVYDKNTNELIGSSRYYDYNQQDSTIAIGYTFLARKFWGGQYNSALKTIMLDYIFKYVDSVLFHIGADNVRSQKALLKLGANKINEVDFDYYGSRLLHFEYSIKKEDWITN